MSVDFDRFPWTPHTALWNPQADSPRGGSANDGREPSTAVAGGQIACFVEEKTAAWAMQKYGVETERKPYLLIAAPGDVTGMVKGDDLVWSGKVLSVEYAPTVYDFGDGFVHAETMLLGERTGGRP